MRYIEKKAENLWVDTVVWASQDFYLWVNEGGGGVEKFGKKRHEGVTGGGGGFEILPSRDLWMIP